MKISVKNRALVIAVVAGASLAAPFAAPASAAQSAACSKVTTPVVNGKATTTLSQCTPASLSAGGSTVTSPGAGKYAGKLIFTISWKNKKGTTVSAIKYTPAKTTGKCPAGTAARITVTGAVTGGTGTAGTIIKKGESVTASVCAAKTGQSTLEPGTKFKL